MRRRVFVIAGEYSANPRQLPPEKRTRAWLSEPHPLLRDEEVTRLFFRFPNRSEDGRATPEDWRRDFAVESPVGLIDLFAAAAHRALTSLHQLSGGDYQVTRDAITHLYVTSMPGLDPNERMNIGLVPQGLRALLRLSRRVVAQYVVGTSDSGAWAFAQAVRAACNAERPVTILVVAGQMIPSGYLSQYQIRTVLGEADQAQGLDMLAIGDLLMDSFRRNLGLSRQEVEKFLARVAARKFDSGAFYPAGMRAGSSFKRQAPRTPYFDASDIAAPCCGAAATIITSDPELALRVGSARNPRYRTAPITEVLGVGEGSSSANFLQRPSPLVFATAVREALADTADDAGLPLSVFPTCAFGIAHDAFPSIELSFILAMGFSWERGAERMAEGWPNPFGGLISFGHALGASGLVQVNKAHHLFCGDERHVKDGPVRRSGFREDGSMAFVTSVGGPLSHIVGCLMRGGFRELPRILERHGVPTEPERPALTRQWWAKRHQLRRTVPAYLRRLRGRVPGEPSLLEGTTYVSIRSALRALSEEEISSLTFDGLERLIAPERLEEVRAQLREVVLVVVGEAERVASMFDAFQLLTDEVRELAKRWRGDGFVSLAAAGLTDERLADRIKECLRVPLAVTSGATPELGARRGLLFLPAHGLTYEALEEIDLLSTLDDGRRIPLAVEPALLPFWNARARRSDPASALRRSGSAADLVDQILNRDGEQESAADLELMRLWFSPDPAPPLLQRALNAIGPSLGRPAPGARVVFYHGIADRGRPMDPAGERELFGRAAREAAAFLEAYETNASQVDDGLVLAAYECPPLRTTVDEAVIALTRFAREVAVWALEHGVVIRAAICAGEGVVFEDANCRANVAAPAAARAAELLARIGSGSTRATIAVHSVGSELLVRLGQRLEGWELDAVSEPDCAIWRTAAASPSF